MWNDLNFSLQVTAPIFCILGLANGLRGDSLGVLCLRASAPTAAASYPMAQAMQADYHLAAAIIAATSLGSLLSTTLGLFVLRYFSLI